MLNKYNGYTLIILQFIAGFALSQPGFSWAKNIGGFQNDYGRMIDLDGLSNVYWAGLFSDSIDLDPGTGNQQLYSLGAQDIFIQKRDPVGNYIFGIQLSCDTEYLADMIVDKFNNSILVLGTFQGEADVDPGPGVYTINSQNGSCFILKLSLQGQFLWVKQIGSSIFHSLIPTTLTSDDSSNFYIGGNYLDSIDLNPSAQKEILYPKDSSNSLVAKYSSTGDLLWVKNIYGRGGMKITDLSTDDKGNFLATGYYSDSANLNALEDKYTFVSVSRSKDIFVIKTDPEGNNIWVKTFGGTEDDIGHAIISDRCENVFFCGSFRDSLDADPNSEKKILVGDSLNDVLIVKLNSSGDLSWAKSFGGKGNESATKIITNKNGEIFVSGEFDKSITCTTEPSDTLLSRGSKDLFIFKCNGLGQLICNGVIGGFQTDSLGGLAVNTKDDIYLSGHFSDSCDADPGNGEFILTSNGSNDAFLVKFLPGTCCNSSVPPSMALATPNEFCAGEITSLITSPAVEGTCPNFVWYKDNCGGQYEAEGDTVSASPVQNVAYFVRTEGPCDTSDCKRVDVVVNPKPIAYFESYVSMNCNGPVLSFENKSILSDSYQWIFSNNELSVLKNPNEQQFSYNTTVEITLIAKNIFGCSDSFLFTTKFTQAEDYFNLFIPNIFTPNSDGINDNFKIRYNGELKECFEVKIFNRWGNIVFTSSNPDFSWDGKNQFGILQPAGTYFYLIQISDIKRRGFIQLSE